MDLKIGIIATYKFVASNYSEVVKPSDIIDITHRNIAFKKIVAFEQYITGYPFDYVFDSIEEYEAWLVTVPASISKLQGVVLLYQKGLYADFIAKINASDELTKIIYDASARWDRSSEMVNNFGVLLKLSSDEIDDFFVEANEIVV